MKLSQPIFIYAIILLVHSLSIEVSAQKLCTIKGKVIDENHKPLSYANVFLKNSFEGAITDDRGNFSFKTSTQGKVTLICTYIGYSSFEKELILKLGATYNIAIILRQTEVRGEPVLVTASAFTAANEEGVTLTSMDVVRTPGAAADLFRAIKTFPGVQQVEEGAGLFVRGGDVSETLVILDGAVINHPYKYESPTGGFFGTFSPFLLKGTFFSSGGFSAQYGNALSGALSMESHDLPDQRRVGLGVGLAAESAYINMPIIDDKLGLSFSGNKSNTKMMFELNNSRKDFSRYPSSFDINLNTTYKFNSYSHIKFFIFREDDKVGVEIDDPDYATYFYGSTSNQLYNFKFNSLIKNKILLQANWAYSNFERKMRLSVMNLDIEDMLYQGRVTAEYELNKNFILRAGTVFFRNRTLISGKVPREELDLNPKATTDPVATNYTSHRSAQFIESVFSFPLGFQLTPGIRGEYESISRNYIVDPRISINYPLTTSSNLTAAWGIYHQYPQPQYYDPYIGNPQLTAMKAAHYIFGYAYKNENKIVRLEAYYKDYKRLLLEDAQLNYTNRGRGFAGGSDIFVKNSYGPISGWISYSWLKARRKWLDLPVLTSPYFDITHNLTFVVNIDLPKRFSMGTSFRYATGKPYTPAPEKHHEQRVPSYQKWDINLTYLHSFFKTNFTVFYLAISNVWGRINIFDYRYSADYKRRDPVESSFGRSVYFGMSFNL